MLSAVWHRKTFPPNFIIVYRSYFYFLSDHWTHSGYYENQIPLELVLSGGGGVGGGAGC